MSWRSKKQNIVSWSPAQAEYRAMVNVTCEIMWLLLLLKKISVSHEKPAVLFCDNKAALYIAVNPVYHEGTKHIEIDCQLIQEKLQDGIIKTLHVSPSDQLADLFTKLLMPTQFKTLLCKIGVHNIYTPS